MTTGRGVIGIDAEVTGGGAFVDVTGAVRGDGAVNGEVTGIHEDGDRSVAGLGLGTEEGQGGGFVQEDTAGGGVGERGAADGRVDVGGVGATDAGRRGEGRVGGGDEQGRFCGGVINEAAGLGGQREVATGGAFDGRFKGDVIGRHEGDVAGGGFERTAVGIHAVGQGDRSGHRGEFEVAGGGCHIGGGSGVADVGRGVGEGDAVDVDGGDGADGEVIFFADAHASGGRCGGEGRHVGVNRIGRADTNRCTQAEAGGDDVGQGRPGVVDRAGGGRGGHTACGSVKPREGHVDLGEQADVTAGGGHRHVVGDRD